MKVLYNYIHKIEIDKKNFLEICNIEHGVYCPLKQFMDKENFISVVKNLNLKNRKFFPFPIYFAINKKYENKCNLNHTIEIFYNKEKVCNFLIESKYQFTLKERKKIGYDLYKTNSVRHPGYLYFKNESSIYLSGKILNFNKKLLKNINFSSPIKIRNKIKKFKKIVGFHTRNVPHKGHEWVHTYGIKKCNNILIQPIVGHFKKGEYSEQTVINANKNLVKRKNLENLKKQIPYQYFFSFINILPKYAGPREALLHAIIRKNYGCTHFLVGRDHAGYRNFYKEYDSQKICIKNQKKLKIKILKFKSPKICKYCKEITNKQCKCKKSKSKNSLIDINGSSIRKLISIKKNVPQYLMDRKIFKNLELKNIFQR
jgi:sulfate adenylyltransferase